MLTLLRKIGWTTKLAALRPTMHSHLPQAHVCGTGGPQTLIRARTESTHHTFKSLRVSAGDSRFCEFSCLHRGARQKNLDYTGDRHFSALLNY